MFNLETHIEHFIKINASDIYVTAGAPCSLRTVNGLVTLNFDRLTDEDVMDAIRSLLPENVVDEFNSTLEYNTAINWKESARLRINLFKQRQSSGMVIRRIHNDIPDLTALGLPTLYGDMMMEKRGLILIVGPTGSGKSTTMASMLEYRNIHGNGHIVTVEDPVEYLLQHKGCIITQRDIGIDTYSFSIGLKNALRQAPDVIVIGEIRDREAMEQAIVFAETGHLCVATLHANNSYQAIERIINFFPEEMQKQVLLNLSLNLRAIISQRLVPNLQGTRTVANEIMLNQGLIKDLIHDGMVREIRDSIAKNLDQGMITFDQHLVELYFNGIISIDTVVKESDTPSAVKLAIKQREVGRTEKISTSPFEKIDTKAQF